MKSQTVSLSLVVLALSAGCYSTKAAFDPYAYAPHGPSKTWNPPSYVVPMDLSDAPPPLPLQEEPFSLAELIDIALTNNVQTKITWAQARAAAANYGQSQSQFFPSLSSSFDYSRARQPSFNATTNGASPITGNQGAPTQVTVSDIYYSLWGPQLQISYLIFDFGTLRSTSEAARQALYNADWTHNDAILTLLQTVMNDFYNYLYQKQLLNADLADVETAQLTLDAAQLGFNTGVRDVSDVLQAKTQLLQNQTTWAAQQQNVVNAYTEMLNNMGLPAHLNLTFQELPTQLPDNDIIPEIEFLISIAMQNRPDLLAAEANFRSKQQTLKAAKTQWLPQINYSLDLGKTYYNKGLHDVYNFTNTFSVSMPLFSGFFYRNAIKIAEANKLQAETQIKQTQLQMIQEITSYHSNVRISYETLRFAKAFLEAAEEQYRVSLDQYRYGTNTILDVVSAQSALSTARAQLQNGFQQWYTSLANLAYSTGILSPSYLTPFQENVIVKKQQEAEVISNEVK